MPIITTYIGESEDFPKAKQRVELFNGRPVRLVVGQPFGNIARVIKGIQGTSAFTEGRSTKLRHGKAGAWPVPKSKGNRF